VNNALSTNGFDPNGVEPPKARYTATAIITAAISPAAKFEIRGW
jgi:hypothetical protein